MFPLFWLIPLFFRVVLQALHNSKKYNSISMLFLESINNVLILKHTKVLDYSINKTRFQSFTQRKSHTNYEAFWHKKRISKSKSTHLSLYHQFIQIFYHWSFFYLLFKIHKIVFKIHANIFCWFLCNSY